MRNKNYTLRAINKAAHNNFYLCLLLNVSLPRDVRHMNKLITLISLATLSTSVFANQNIATVSDISESTNMSELELSIENNAKIAMQTITIDLKNYLTLQTLKTLSVKPAVSLALEHQLKVKAGDKVESSIGE